mgnify:FL=1
MSKGSIVFLVILGAIVITNFEIYLSLWGFIAIIILLIWFGVKRG